MQNPASPETPLSASSGTSPEVPLSAPLRAAHDASPEAPLSAAHNASPGTSFDAPHSTPLSAPSGACPNAPSSAYPEASPSAAHDIPASLRARLDASYEAAVVRDILDGFAAPRHTTFRANTLKAHAEDIAAALDQAHIPWSTPSFSSDAFIIDAAYERMLRTLDIYERGHIYVQNLSAMLPALALNPQPGENILDMAAAPGGKTCQIAALSRGEALITACEKNPIRAQKLRYNLSKQGVGRCSVMECDARKLDPFFTFDKVLLDAPCSGSGTVSLEGGSYRGGFSDELLARSMSTQTALLRRALAAVRPGGIVAYATCSILPEENEQAIRRALEPARDGSPRTKGRRKGAKKHARAEEHAPIAPARAEIVPLPEQLLSGIELLPCSLVGTACVKPTGVFEGFFLALLRRIG